MTLNVFQIIMTPFAVLLKNFYDATGSYGLALIIFSLVTKVILYPLALKGKRGMIKMNALTGEQQALQRKYGKDQNRYNLEVQKLYEKEGVSPYGGCLWSMLPMPLLIGMFGLVRSPLTYFMGLPAAALETLKALFLDGVVTGVPEILIAKELGNPVQMAAAKAAVPEFASRLFAVDFSFIGVDLSATPALRFWENGITWAAFGLFLLPLVSGGLSLLTTHINTKTNKLSTNSGQQNNMMLLLMGPVMSIWFGFTMPAGVAIYWIANNFFGIAQELVMARVLRKEYAVALERKAEIEQREKEEEKLRKAELAIERARRQEEEKRNRGKKALEKMKPVREGNAEASRDGLRAYARGRAYEPNRFGGVTPYEGGAPVPVRMEKGKMIAADEELDETTAPIEEIKVTTTAIVPQDDLFDDELPLDEEEEYDDFEEEGDSGDDEVH